MPKMWEQSSFICIVLKTVENSNSMLYQHSNIIERGGVGGGGGRAELNNLEKGVALLFILYSWYK